MAKIDLSIIVSTRDRAAHLRETLKAIVAAMEASDLRSELVIVDNASQDETRSLIEATGQHVPNLRYVYEEKRGLSNARNGGMANSSGDIILVADDDTRPRTDWIAAMTGPILSGTSSVVAGGTVMATHLERPWMEPIHRAFLAETVHDNPYMRQALVGANFALARKVLEKVPQFDSELGPGTLGFADDSLFGLQVAEAGYEIHHPTNEGAILEHHFDPSRLSRDAFLSHARRHGQSWAYVKRHWEHEMASPATLQVKALRKKLLLQMWRQKNPAKIASAEGINTAEMDHYRSIHLYQQWVQELKRPPLYSVRGLRKNNAN